MLFDIELARYDRMPVSCDRFVINDPEIPDPYWIRENERRISQMIVAFQDHSHEEIEIITVLRGTLFGEVDGELVIITPGDIMIANPYELHNASIIRHEITDYIHVTFDIGYFAGCCGTAVSDTIRRLCSGELRFPSRLDAVHPAAEKINGLANGILEAFDLAVQTPGASECQLSMQLVSLLGILIGEVKLSEGGTSHARSVHFTQRCHRYIGLNFRQNINTELAAAELGYNKSYFCTRFKQNFGMTFMNYLSERRIQYAMTWFRDKDVPLREIAEACGFQDYSYFARVFRKHTGMTPREYFLK